jgi:hypothetical protein
MSMSQHAMDHDSAKQSTAYVLRELRAEIARLSCEPSDAYMRGRNDGVSLAVALADVRIAEVSR